ncbi:hypothetical protein ACFH04_01960 [Streptomyces noboritoensis]|uniref:Uncharacterized protein n=1 Tax=Streptomyces noboritoensis TaxID=67337 RepID=A0ABV6T9P0_9ACTN
MSCTWPVRRTAASATSSRRRRPPGCRRGRTRRRSRRRTRRRSKLVAVSGDERAWGRAWHAPVITTTVRHAATDLAERHGAPEPRLESLTERDLALLSFADPLWREFAEMSYMSERPFIVDDSDIRDTFGLKSSTLREALAA